MKYYHLLQNISILSALLFITISSLNGQHVHTDRCLTSTKTAQALENNPDLQKQRNQWQKTMDQWMKKYDREEGFQKSRTIITIPVVVHILYKNTTQNISDSQIQSQMDVLNADFRKLNSDFSNTPSVFQPIAADVEVEFCLASFDPNGNATNGVTRTSVSNNFNLENNYYNSNRGGVPAWDRDKYMNMWVGDIGGGTLGFAWIPNSAPSPAEDGVVVDYRCFGTNGTAGSGGFESFNLGRTATHEVGHWLNLEHVWGPGNGGCGEDDFVSDTPNQNEPTYGCETFPLRDNCTAGNGIMFQNYMDYSDDRCMSLFTNGQKTRMLAALNGPRSGLLTSNGCQGTKTECGDMNLTAFAKDSYINNKSITTNATVSNGQNVTLSASDCILMNANFTISQGGTMTASIEACPE